MYITYDSSTKKVIWNSMERPFAWSDNLQMAEVVIFPAKREGCELFYRDGEVVNEEVL